MISHKSFRVGFVALVAFGAGSCVTGAKLREDAKLIEKKIANARERGAYRCAPKELAKAEANLEFLSYELEQGDFRRAQRHHTAALENIDKAIAITDPNECAEKRVLIAEDRPLVITKTDRDGDGIKDDVDQCPDEPEDVDGFQDQDGCPDPDNDGDQILDKDDKCPNEPGPRSNQGCPVKDRDGDGIPDDVDKCPDIPEDIDGFEDEDGCPEGGPNKDTDGDGIPDKVDQCPNDPGPAPTGCPARDRDGDGVMDDVDQCPDIPGPAPTGCPKKVLVVKTGDKIEIKQQINFATNKAKIIGQISFDILDQVGAVFKSNPTIKVVIEGHTDNVGKADYNLKLSDSRANSVRQALIERGVDAGRLEAIGYGQSKPIASNRTAKGRAANRRVEFKIVGGGDEQPTETPPPTPPTTR